MKTLQDLIDAKVAELRAADNAAAEWRNGQAQREAAVADLFAQGLAQAYDLTLGDDAYTVAHEADNTPTGATERYYEVALVLPAIDAVIETQADFYDNALTLSGRAWSAFFNDNQRDFPNNGSRLAALVEALVWVTDAGRISISGDPVLVTLPQPVAQEI